MLAPDSGEGRESQLPALTKKLLESDEALAGITEMNFENLPE
jgi:hypothetical protein